MKQWPVIPTAEEAAMDAAFKSTLTTIFASAGFKQPEASAFVSTTRPARLITPGEFDSMTSRTLVGEDRAQQIEGDARAHADSADLANPVDAFQPCSCLGRTYWDHVRAHASYSIYCAAFNLRIERRLRKEPALTKRAAA